MCTVGNSSHSVVPGGKDDCHLAKQCNTDLNSTAHNIVFNIHLFTCYMVGLSVNDTGLLLPISF